MTASIQILSASTLVLTFLASCRGCSSLPAEIDHPSWSQVRESLDDWSVRPPERGTPTRLETTEGLKGNHRRLVVAFRDESQREQFLREFEATCRARTGSASSTHDSEFSCVSKLESNADGFRWAWHVALRRGGSGSSSVVEIEAWQPYD